MTLSQLAREIKHCTRCPLRESATAPVPGIGEIGIKYMLLGEAPGRNEDIQGVPFVGKAGRRLNELLELAQIDANDCFFTNVVKCRPPGNRDPRKGELKECRGWLDEEIRLVKPGTIITLGRIPLQVFSNDNLKQRHGTTFLVEIDD